MITHENERPLHCFDIDGTGTRCIFLQTGHEDTLCVLATCDRERTTDSICPCMTLRSATLVKHLGGILDMYRVQLQPQDVEPPRISTNTFTLSEDMTEVSEVLKRMGIDCEVSESE